MFGWLEEATALLEAGVGDLDPSELSGEEAVRAMALFGRASRLCTAGLTLCAGQAVATDAHFGAGARSPAELVARETGGSLAEAISIVSVAGAIPELSAVEEALRKGELSPAQAGAVTTGAGGDEKAAERMLEAAGKLPLSRLRDKAKHEKAARDKKEEKRQRLYRLWRERSLTTRVGADGEVRGEFMLPPVEGARFLSAIENEIKAIIDEAARSGERGTRANYAADALAALAMREPRAGTGQTTIVLTTDVSAFRRGDTGDGETCVLSGVGPVPVAVAEEILGEATLKVVIRDGVDIANVCTPGRVVPAAIRTALAVRDPFCVVPGCGASLNLEIDHWQIPVNEGGQTAMWNCCRLCRYHHRLRTHRGWRLLGGPGRWRWLAPGEADVPLGEEGVSSDGGREAAPGPAPRPDGGTACSGESGAEGSARPEGSVRPKGPERPEGPERSGGEWRLFEPGSAA